MSSSELLLEENTKMLTDNGVLSDKIAIADRDAIILNTTVLETPKAYENTNLFFESESSGNTKEKLSKACSNLLSGSEENTEESTIIDANLIENKLWEETTTEIIESDIIPTDRSEVDTTSMQNVTTDISVVEARDIEYEGTSDVSDQVTLFFQSTESAPQNLTSHLDKAYTADFSRLHLSKAKTTSQSPIGETTESVPLTKASEEISTHSPTILGTFEIRKFFGDTAVENKIDCETPSSNANKNLDSETFETQNIVTDVAVEKKPGLENTSSNSKANQNSESRKDKYKLNLFQTTTNRSRDLNSLSTPAPIKPSSKSPSRPKQIHTLPAWYTNLIPISLIYLLNPLNYMYNSTNQTLSGPGSLPTTWNYTTLFNPPIINFPNLPRQILHPDASTTARHGFFRHTQSNITNFQFFPFFRLFNATHHLNKTKFAANTQTDTALNGSDVLSALHQHKNAKFQQRQTDQTNGNNNNAVFVSRQWYTPLVSDNLERSEEVPFLTPVVRYSNNDPSYYRSQGQQLLTPVISYVERGEPYRIERPHYYRERPKLVKRPIIYYREQPYYSEGPYNFERPYEVEHPTHYHHPVKTDVKVQSGPISYESSPMDLSYMEPVIDIDEGGLEYYYRNKKLNSISLKSAEDKPKGATTSLMAEVEVRNPVYEFMKSIYNLFMSNI